MPRSRSVAVACLAVVVAMARPATGQGAALSRGLDLETAGKLREAATAYRLALGDGGDITSAVLGLERVYSQLGRSDSLMPLIDSLLVFRGRDPILRTVQLRTLSGLRRDADAEAAFVQWRRTVPRDAKPYREYARLLLDGGRAASADTVLQEAVRVLGSAREFASELAQMRAAMGLWEPSAHSWRDAVRQEPYLEQAAVFALYPTPAPIRDKVRAALSAEPLQIAARRILAGLELRWSSPREAWRALAALPPGDSVVAAWVEFAADAEQNEAWLVSRDALVHALKHGAPRTLGLRAANHAIAGGEPATALELIQPLAERPDSLDRGEILLVQVRALAALGRAGEAEAAIAIAGSALGDDARAQVARAMAWGWVRAGDLPKARAALKLTGGNEADDRATAWIALYEGDLRTARTSLRRTDETSRDVVLAMSLLARTRADSSAAVGEAFLALARGDTANAAQRFENVAGSLPDAAPLLLSVAARLYASRQPAKSAELWRTIVESHPQSPEAAEADLDWARALRKAGDTPGAMSRLEHLILTYPQSALVPQARRELELARNGVPPQP